MSSLSDSYADMKVPIHVEVSLIQDIEALTLEDEENVINTIKERLSTYHMFENGLTVDDITDIAESITICDISSNKPAVSFWQADLCIHLFKLSEEECDKDYLEGEEEGVPAYEQWIIPNRYFVGIWDSIVVDDSIKQRLLGYCDSSIQFSEAKVNSSIISWNRLVLLYGPPGTGKTTLCKALAQKVYIRNSHRYKSGGVLLEINSHSLFSKWFSESGKLVMKLFDQIHDIADDEDTFVCILIDEVESIASTRSSSVRSNEPGDAVRVVNSVLTSLDTLRRRPNVLVLCTSNMISSIDPAFRDRIDLQVHLGLPPLKARYQILHSCISELMQKGIIYPSIQINLEHENMNPTFSGSMHSLDCSLTPEQMLNLIAYKCEGMSGRGLRKLPMKAHAFYLQRPRVTLLDFMRALKLTLDDKEVEEAESLL